MKLNNLQKNFYIFFSIIVSILVVTLLWEKINLQLNNTNVTKGFFAARGYNPINDTIRYIFFVGLPLIIFLFLNQILNKRFIKISDLIFEENRKVDNNHSSIIFISLIFIAFIFLEFFSISFSFTNYKLDHFHDGNYLTPTQNYIFNKNFWLSSYLTHGGSNIFYPLLMWKIFGVESIGVTRTFTIFLVLILKLLSVLLSYQLTKITNLERTTKILFFTIFTAIIISMSNYTFLGASYYISHKDIYIILFLIFFIELFINSRFRTLASVSICIIATISILFQVDKGFYINFILFFYSFYLILAKKYKDFLLIISFLILSWCVVIAFFGLEEFKAFFYNTKTVALTMDLMHGLKYPTPFFSLENNSDGARATRGLLLQITAGLFILNYLISNKNNIFCSQKILFVFLLLLSLVMYKNALGRSDAPHIRDSTDMPILINCFFILNYILIFFSKRSFSYRSIFSLSILFLLFFNMFNINHYKVENIKNYKKNFTYFINLEDEIFLNKKTVNLIKYYSELTKNENCVENITFFDAIPYLLKKPSCTKYWASWLMSPTTIQRDYIARLKKVQPKYILYSSSNLELDGVGVYKRIELINSYVLSNYKKHDEFDNYVILKKK